MIAGPNGSGKTTLTQYLAAAGVNFGNYINPDDIAKTLVGPTISAWLRHSSKLTVFVTNICSKCAVSHLRQ